MIGAVITTAFFLLLLQNVITQLPLPGTHSLDEILTAIIFLIGIAVQAFEKKSISRIAVATLALCFYLVAISVSFGFNRSVFDIVVQSYISTKFFFLAAGMYSLYICRDLRYGKLMTWLISLTLLGLLMQGLLGQQFYSLLHIVPKLHETFDGFSRLSGFQLNANAAGVALAFGAVCLFVRLRDTNKSSRNIYIAIGILTLAILLTGSRSALAFELIGMAFTFRFRRALVQILFVGIVVTFIVFTQSDVIALLYQKTISNLGAIASGGNANYPRWIMAYYGAQLAWTHFPIGTGAATFGSVLSTGSQLYGQLNLLAFQSIAGGAGIYDSNFGSIAGEYGFIGIILFYGLLVYVIQRFVKAAELSGGWLGLSRIAWLFVIMGIAATFLRPLFSSSYYGSLFVLTLMFSVQKYRTSQDLEEKSSDDPSLKHTV